MERNAPALTEAVLSASERSTAPGVLPPPWTATQWVCTTTSPQVASVAVINRVAPHVHWALVLLYAAHIPLVLVLLWWRAERKHSYTKWRDVVQTLLRIETFLLPAHRWESKATQTVKTLEHWSLAACQATRLLGRNTLASGRRRQSAAGAVHPPDG